MKYFIGIDPGQSGAMAVINEQGDCCDLFDWPGDEVSLINRFIPEAYSNVRAALESVHAMPRQGVSSTFKFGTNFGIWKGVLASYKIPFELVTPQAWQKGVIKRADGKQASLIAARRRWPTVELHLKKHHGRADALWIAEWLRLKYVHT
jgi:hypothetical protein